MCSSTFGLVLDLFDMLCEVGAVVCCGFVFLVGWVCVWCRLVWLICVVDGVFWVYAVFSLGW